MQSYLLNFPDYDEHLLDWIKEQYPKGKWGEGIRQCIRAAKETTERSESGSMLDLEQIGQVVREEMKTLLTQYALQVGADVNQAAQFVEDQAATSFLDQLGKVQ